MAVKKAIARKAIAKKTSAKKATSKKATAKKPAAKKPAAKKATSRKVVAKRPVARKAPVKKKVAKKAVAKKVASKKSAVKKSAVKKGAVKKSVVERIVIPEAPIISSRSSRVEITSTPPPVPSIVSAPVATPAPAKKQGASGRVVFAVVLGIILLGLIVWSKSNNSDTGKTATPTASASTSASPSESPSPTPSESPTPVAISAHEAPQGVVAHYTTGGATIFWKAPSAIEGLTGYNIEISVSSGPWTLISTVPSSQLSLGVKKDSSNGWTSFKVSSVYSDSVTTPAKAFGLPGTYS